MGEARWRAPLGTLESTHRLASFRGESDVENRIRLEFTQMSLLFPIGSTLSYKKEIWTSVTININ